MILGSPEPLTLAYTPEIPKLLLEQIARLEASCSLTMSCIPVSKISTYHRQLLNHQRENQFRLASFSQYPSVLEQARTLLATAEDTTLDMDLGSKVWAADRTTREVNTHDHTQHISCLISWCLTGFWAMCFQETFIMDHKRSFGWCVLYHPSNIWDPRLASCFLGTVRQHTHAHASIQN